MAVYCDYVRRRRLITGVTIQQPCQLQFRHRHLDGHRKPLTQKFVTAAPIKQQTEGEALTDVDRT